MASGEVWSNITVAGYCATNVSEATCRVSAGADPSPRYRSVA